MKYDKNYIKFIEDRIKDYCKASGIKGVVVGISGGKDSTIVAALMARVLGNLNVVGVLMPNGNQEDIEDARKVVEILGIRSFEINIENAYSGLVEALKVSVKTSEQALMNVAPRLRMTTLYTIAQSLGHGYRVVGTTNKSEEYIGWLTKWGDGAADFEPIIEFTVTELKQIGKALGLPADLVDKVPIDGLAVGSDEERFGFTYYQLDNYIMNGTSMIEEVDAKIAKMHEYSEHKRQLVPRVEYTPYNQC